MREMDTPEAIREAEAFLDRTLKNAEPPRFLIIGKTGVGKSTFINTLFGEDVAAAKSGASCTDDVRSYELKACNTVYLSLIDTPGLWDSEGRDSEHKEAIVDYIKSLKVDAILFLASALGGRCDINDQKMIREYAEVLGPHIEGYWKKIILVLTRAGGGKYDDPEQALKNLEKLIDVWREQLAKASGIPELERSPQQIPVQGVDTPVNGQLIIGGKDWLRPLLEQFCKVLDVGKYIRLLNGMNPDFPRMLSEQLYKALAPSAPLQVRSRRLNRREAEKWADNKKSYRDRVADINTAAQETLFSASSKKVSKMKFFELTAAKLRALRVQDAVHVVCNYPFEPASHSLPGDFLQLEVGDSLAVYSQDDEIGTVGWGFGEKLVDGSQGYFPLNHVVMSQ